MDLLQAMADQARRATTTVEHGRTRVRFSRHKLLVAFAIDVEHAALLERRRMGRKAAELIERGRQRTIDQLIKRHGFARVAKHMTLIDRVLTRHEARVRRSVER